MDKQTKAYLSEIKSGLENLALSPELGKFRNEIDERVRSFNVNRHIIFLPCRQNRNRGCSYFTLPNGRNHTC